MPWVVHSTVPYPMLKEPGTPRMLFRRRCRAGDLLLGGDSGRDPPAEAESVAETLRDAGIRSLSFHAPFEDVWPGARDEEVRRFAVRRIEGAIALAPIFRPPGSFSTAGIPTGSSTSSRKSGSPRPGDRSENSPKRRRRREPTCAWRTSSTKSPTTCSACGRRWALPASTSASTRGTRRSSPVCRSRSGRGRSGRESV